MRTFGAKSKIKHDKSPCYLCNKFFVNPTKHLPNCKKRFDGLIGPLPELLTCHKCNNDIYKCRYYETHLSKNGMINVVEYYSYDEHLEICDGSSYKTDKFILSAKFINIEEY